MTRDDPSKRDGASEAFAERADAQVPAPDIEPAPSAAWLFSEELRRIELRIDRVIVDGRAVFHEGTDSYDRAAMAVIRLSALFERPDTFGPFLAAATEDERRAIAHTRNIASHRGYVGMDDDLFWRTVTSDIPVFIAKIRAANDDAPAK